MIDGIGKAGAGRLGLVRGSTERGAPVGQAGGSLSQSGASGASNPVAAMASQGAPVDSAKVAAVRAAIAEGRYPINPDKIAAAMIDLDLPLFDGR